MTGNGTAQSHLHNGVTHMFEVYTYFGRVLARHAIQPNELHHVAAEKARKDLLLYERQGTACWVRYVR